MSSKPKTKLKEASAERIKFVSKQIQSDETTANKFFEALDYRKCLRCGLNDKIALDECRFHPSYPNSTGGAGKLLYSSEWHACREKCGSKSKAACHVSKEHYYGTHLSSNT